MAVPLHVRSLLILALQACACSADAAERCPSELRMAVSSVPDARTRDDTVLRHLLDGLAPELARLTGTPIRFEFMPRGRAFVELLNGHMDLVPVASRTAERDAHLDFAPLGRLRPMLVMRKDLQAQRRPTSVDHLLAGTLTVAAVRGQDFGPRVSELTGRLQRQGRFISLTDQIVAVRMLKAGRVDALVGLPVFFTPMLAAEGIAEQTEIVDVGLEAIEEGVYVSRSLPAACRAAIDAAVASARNSGFYRRLLDRVIPPAQRGSFVD